MLLGTKEKMAFSSDQGAIYASTTMGETGVVGWRHRRSRDHDRRLWLAGLDTGQHRGVPRPGTREYGACRRFHAHLCREVPDATRCPGQTDRVSKNECM